MKVSIYSSIPHLSRGGGEVFGEVENAVEEHRLLGDPGQVVRPTGPPVWRGPFPAFDAVKLP